MKFEEISHMIVKADVQNFPAKVKLKNSEVNQLLSQLIEQSIESLPENIKSKLHFEKLISSHFYENLIEIVVRFRLTPNQLLLPNKSKVDVSSKAKWVIEDGHFQIESLQFDQEVVSKGIFQKVIEWTANKALAIKEDSIEDQIISKVNPTLKYPILLLPKIKEFIPSIDYIDYELKNLQLVEFHNLLIIELLLSIYVNEQKNSTDLEYIHVGLVKEHVTDFIMKLISENPPDVPKVDLEILDIDIPSPNKILVNIKVTYGIVSMNAEVEMDIITKVESQEIQFDVIDITPNANILVQKSFGLIKDDIMQKIEEKSIFSISEVIKNVPSSFMLMQLNREMNVGLLDFKVLQVNLSPFQDMLNLRVDYEIERIEVT